MLGMEDFGLVFFVELGFNESVLLGGLGGFFLLLLTGGPLLVMFGVGLSDSNVQ